MRTGAEVEEFAVAVKAHLLVFRNVVEAAQFVTLLTHCLDFFNGLFAAALDSFKFLVFFNDFFHLALKGFKVGGIEWLIEVNVVIETIFGGRADIKLGLGMQAQDRGGQYVRSRVANFLKGRHFFHRT